MAARADDGDTWLHHILTSKNLTAAEPRIKVKYLQARIDDTIGDKSKPWEGEISGRVLSLCAEIKEYAESCAKTMGGLPAFRLRAVMYAEVSKIRSQGLDVVLDPTSEDVAHALITIKSHLYALSDDGKIKKISVHLVILLRSVLSVVDDSGIDDLQSRCGNIGASPDKSVV